MTSAETLLVTEELGFAQAFTFNPKEGIDNPALVISDDPEPDPTIMPRLCLLKRSECQTFGFHLRLDQRGRGYEITNVEPWSPAVQSGLKAEDRLLEVNEENVDKMEFNEIQSSGPHLFLLVLRKEEYDQVQYEPLPQRKPNQASKGDSWSRPRLCHVSRDPEHGLGMSFTGEWARFSVSTVTDGAAEKAGVRTGDALVWINGVSASVLTLASLSRMVSSGDPVTVLVVEPVSASFYVRRKVPIFPELAENINLPHAAKTMRLERRRDGYGFLLRQERDSGFFGSDPTAHMLREVDAASAAEDAGMTDGDVLLAVNEEPVEDLEHEEVVNRIRASGDRVTLTSISAEGRRFYRTVGDVNIRFVWLGISPLLFLDDSASPSCTQMEDAAPKTPSCDLDKGEPHLKEEHTGSCFHPKFIVSPSSRPEKHRAGTQTCLFHSHTYPGPTGLQQRGVALSAPGLPTSTEEMSDSLHKNIIRRGEGESLFHHQLTAFLRSSHLVNGQPLGFLVCPLGPS
uniref:PDZ domain-containing protein n=1 Tax=Oryzias latipes TaxID=8090 RepID=A0A3P9KF12_ORYLA